MRLLFRILILMLLALIAYNYFLGSDEEKADSQQVVESAKQLGQSLIDMVVAERERFSEGKYDEMRDNIGSSIGFLKERGDELNISDSQLDSLDSEKVNLDSMIQRLDGMTEDSEEAENLQEQINQKINELVRKMDELVN